MMRIILSGLLLVLTNAWAQTRIDLGNQGRNVDFSNAVITKPATTGTVLPATCSTGQIFFNLNSPPGSNLYVCVATNSWANLTAGSGSGGSGGGPATAIATATVGTLPNTCSVGNVLFATDANLTGGGYFLYYCGSANAWTQTGYVAGGTGALVSNCSTLPCTVDVTAAVPLKAAANSWTGGNDFSAAAKTAPFRIGPTNPGACDPTTREFFFNTSSNQLEVCTSSGVWSPMGASTPVFSSGNGYFAPYGLAANPTPVNWAATGGSHFACTQMVAPSSMTLNTVGLIVGTAPAAGKALVAGYMDSNFNVLAQGRTTTATSSTNAVISLSTSLTLLPGIYYQCVGGEDINTTLYPAMGGSAPGFGLTLNQGSGQRIFTCSNVPSGSGATYTLPPTCGTPAEQNTYPIIASVLLP